MYETIEYIYDCSKAVLRGVENGVLNLIDDLCHPYDNIICPLSELLFDATVIALAHTDARATNVGDIYSPELVNFAAIVDKNSFVYKQAVERMNERIRCLKIQGFMFSVTNDLGKIEMISGMLTTVFVPGAVMKAFKATVKLHRTDFVFSTEFVPHPSWPSKVPMPVKYFSPAEVRSFVASSEQGHLMYVITNGGQVLISSTKMAKPLKHANVMPTDKVKIYSTYTKDHRDLAMTQPVYIAGNIKVDNGFITYIDTESKVYHAQQSNAEIKIRKHFEYAGYGEVGNPQITKFHDLYDPNYRPTNIVEHHTMLKSTLFGFTLLAIKSAGTNRYRGEDLESIIKGIFYSNVKIKIRSDYDNAASKTELLNAVAYNNALYLLVPSSQSPTWRDELIKLIANEAQEIPPIYERVEAPIDTSAADQQARAETDAKFNKIFESLNIIKSAYRAVSPSSVAHASNPPSREMVENAVNQFNANASVANLTLLQLTDVMKIAFPVVQPTPSAPPAMAVTPTIDLRKLISNPVVRPAIPIAQVTLNSLFGAAGTPAKAANLVALSKFNLVALSKLINRSVAPPSAPASVGQLGGQIGQAAPVALTLSPTAFQELVNSVNQIRINAATVQAANQAAAINRLLSGLVSQAAPAAQTSGLFRGRNVATAISSTALQNTLTGIIERVNSSDSTHRDRSSHDPSQPISNDRRIVGGIGVTLADGSYSPPTPLEVCRGSNGTYSSSNCSSSNSSYSNDNYHGGSSVQDSSGRDVTTSSGSSVTYGGWR